MWFRVPGGRYDLGCPIRCSCVSPWKVLCWLGEQLRNLVSAMDDLVDLGQLSCSEPFLSSLEHLISKVVFSFSFSFSEKTRDNVH